MERENPEIAGFLCPAKVRFWSFLAKPEERATNSIRRIRRMRSFVIFRKINSAMPVAIAVLAVIMMIFAFARKSKRGSPSNYHTADDSRYQENSFYSAQDQNWNQGYPEQHHASSHHHHHSGNDFSHHSSSHADFSTDSTSAHSHSDSSSFDSSSGSDFSSGSDSISVD